MVQSLRRGLKVELQALPGARWAPVLLALVVELAGDLVEMMPGDTEPPLPLCGEQKCVGFNTQEVPKILHCTRPLRHSGDCDFEALP